MRKYFNFAKRTLHGAVTASVIQIEDVLAPRYSDLIILDDIFPHLLSAFRITEYNTYLERFRHSHVYSTGASFNVLEDTRRFATIVSEYEREFPNLKERVTQYHPNRRMHAQLAYTIFIWNAFSFLGTIERNKLPFIFTLYPGGGFALEDPVCNEKLRRVCSSPYLRGVIVTQKITHEYLLVNNFCDPGLIRFIYGGVFQRISAAVLPHNKKRFGQDKNSFDICFVANKYTPRGIDKGFDIFIEVASQFSKTHKDVAFHVVGNFRRDEITTTDAPNLRFYGHQTGGFFEEFYSHMDVILSPNAPFLLGPGAFDGFPTGACAEAGMSGVVVFCTDILNQNIYFKDREEIVLISRDAREIQELLDFYYRHYNELVEISMRGHAKFENIFGPEMQLHPRLQLLEQYVN